jgi:predicted DNA-binding transcriptional regulator YafY
MWLLKSGRPWTTTALARELEVSPRTILRDVEALSTAGVPVYCERGRAGGVRLLPGFTTDVAALTDSEAQALLSAVTAAPLAALGMAEDLAGALRKVTAALPEQTRSSARLADRILIDPAGWHGIPAPAGFDIIQRAVWDSRRLVLHYQARTAQRSVRRTIDPAGLVNAAGVWYVAGFHRHRLHFYHLNRIIKAQILPESAVLPQGFDLATAWSQSRSQWRSGHVPVVVRVQVRAPAVRQLHPSVQPPTLSAPTDRNGWVELELTFGDWEHALTVVTAMGSDLIVLSPPELRQTVAARARQVLALYE